MNVVLPDSSILGSIRLRYPELRCKHGNLERLINQVLRDEALTERIVAGAVIEAMQDTILHVNGYSAHERAGKTDESHENPDGAAGVAFATSAMSAPKALLRLAEYVDSDSEGKQGHRQQS